MLQSCFPCRKVLRRLSVNVLGTKDVPLQSQHALAFLIRIFRIFKGTCVR